MLPSFVTGMIFSIVLLAFQNTSLVGGSRSTPIPAAYEKTAVSGGVHLFRSCESGAATLATLRYSKTSEVKLCIFEKMAAGGSLAGHLLGFFGFRVILKTKTRLFLDVGSILYANTLQVPRGLHFVTKRPWWNTMTSSMITLLCSISNEHHPCHSLPAPATFPSKDESSFAEHQSILCNQLTNTEDGISVCSQQGTEKGWKGLRPSQKTWVCSRCCSRWVWILAFLKGQLVF